MDAKDHYSKASIHPSILVVDDDPVFRLLLCKQLEQLGFEVDQAHDGIAAISANSRIRFGLIFMDIQMPNMNGLLATSAIRSYEEQLHRTPTPIIATTSGVASRELCLTVGMSDYLEKPVDMQDLERVLETWL